MLGVVLGLIDLVSVIVVLVRLGVSGWTLMILEGELLVNDATGLIVYWFVLVVSLVTLFGEVGWFVVVVVGGIVIGFAVGWLFLKLRSFVCDLLLDVMLLVLMLFVVYVLVEQLGVFGVLVIVTVGVFIGLCSLDVVELGTRLCTVAFW